MIDQTIIFGSSGHVGLAQQLKWVVKRLWDEKSFVKKADMDYGTPEGAMNLLRTKLWEVTAPEFGAAQIAAPVIGVQAASQTACNDTIIALPLAQKPYLLTFNQQCSPEMATPDVPFVSVGSGQPIADPFLAFLRSMFWSDHLPSLGEGVFAAVWTLDQTIESAPGFVAHPIQIMVMEKTKQGYTVRELDKDELQECRDTIGGAKDCLRNFRNLIQTAAIDETVELEQ